MIELYWAIVDDPGASFGRSCEFIEVMWGYPRSPAGFINKSRLKRAGDMGLISLCLSCHDASTGMQYELRGPTCDLHLRSNIDLNV